MKFKTLLVAAVAMSMGIGGLAFGQRNDDRNGRNDRGHRSDKHQRSDRHDRNDRDDRWRAEPNRRGGARDGQHDYGVQPTYRGQPRWQESNHWRRDGRGAGPGHAIYRGSRLPIEYRSRQYVVDDWHGHHLYAPPRGYHWVQAGGDYLLVAITTGIILQLLLAN